MKKRRKKIPTVLHLGCGMSKRAGALGVDIDPRSDADVVHDLNKFPYPFPRNHFKVVVAEHILEHLEDLVRVMSEIHRICDHDALITIISPHFTSVDSFTDITHRHHFTSRSFDYFVKGTDLFKYQYAKVRFAHKRVVLGPDTNNIFLGALLKLINAHQVLYESRFAYIFPVGVIRIDLRVDKS